MKPMKTICLLFFLLLFAAGCTASDPNIRISTGPAAKTHKGNGPPPHAPAHGYRAKHQGHDLTFDTGLGVYVVVDLPSTYFHNGLYFRLGDSGEWMASVELGTGWRPAKDYEVPSKLKEKKEKKGKGRGKKKGKNKS